MQKLPNDSLIIVPGQIYLHDGHNEYIVVIKNKVDIVHWQGSGFKGCRGAEEFLNEFLPVDPEDLDEEELAELQAFTEATLKVGFVRITTEVEYDNA